MFMGGRSALAARAELNDAGYGGSTGDAAEVKIFRRDGASSYGWLGNLAVVLGRHPLEVAHVANFRACVVELYRRYPAGVGVVTIVEDTSLPSASGRDALLEMFKECWPMMNGALFIPNATGFRGAVLRSVMGGLMLACGQRDRVKVVASVPAGASWLAHKLRGEGATPQFIELLAEKIGQFHEQEILEATNGGPASGRMPIRK